MSIEIVHQQYREIEIAFGVESHRSDNFSQSLRGDWKPGSHLLAADQMLGPDDLFLDLGANVGAFCIPVAKQSGASCVAVEALESNIPSLHIAIAENGLSNQINWRLAAIIDKNGEVALSGDSAYGHVQRDGGGPRVIAYSIDGLMDELGWPSVKVVKMDIEGCEMLALDGASRFIDRNPNVSFVFEANAAHSYARGYQPQELIRFFEIRGYYVYLVRGGHAIRRTYRDFQESGVSDYVACKTPLENFLSGFEFDDFSLEYKKSEVMRALTIMKPGYRNQMISQMNIAPVEIQKDVDIINILSKNR